MSDLTLDSPITVLKGIGKAAAEKLRAKNICRIADFLFILPLRYVDKTSITPIADAVVGQAAQLCVTIQAANIKYGGRRSLHLICTDATGTIDIRLFHFGQAQLKSLSVGARMLVFGNVSAYKGGISMMHPEYKLLKPTEIPILSDSLTPIYPSIGEISTKRLAKWIAEAVKLVDNYQYVEFSAEFLTTNQLCELREALKLIHLPSIKHGVINFSDGAHPALRRLILDEVLAKQISLVKQRNALQQELGMSIPIKMSAHDDFQNALPFTLTNAQSRAIRDIFSDISKPIPMHRLIQGDVGSGKTLVAFAACQQACIAGIQSVLMAPTEILAEQHFINASQFLNPFGLNVVRLSGKQKAAEKKAIIKQISTGNADLIIGTHAVFQKEIMYARLGLVIIDEQHRFGVAQRLELKKKAVNYHPHLLVMTATPIPRTLAMSYYADLETSIIDERPPGRQPIITTLLANSRLTELTERIISLCKCGRQVYWVCALIDESEHLDCAAAEKRFDYLTSQLPQLNIGLLHGQLDTDTKADTMRKFSNGDIDVMVCTTVLEVGVDVPNAVLMVIENAERFGLAQLHQLRGRVGRGSHASYCILMYQEPLSDIAKKRLVVIKENNDGFAIANEDLHLRGAGEILGTRQTGVMDFRITNMQRDAELFELGYTLVDELISTHPEMANEIVQRWQSNTQAYLNA